MSFLILKVHVSIESPFYKNFTEKEKERKTRRKIHTVPSPPQTKIRRFGTFRYNSNLRKKIKKKKTLQKTFFTSVQITLFRLEQEKQKAF